MSLPDELLINILDRVVPIKALECYSSVSEQFRRCAQYVRLRHNVREGMTFTLQYREPPRCPSCQVVHQLKVVKVSKSKGTEAITWAHVREVDPIGREVGPTMRKKVCKRPSGTPYVSNRLHGSSFPSKFDLDSRCVSIVR